MRDGISDASDAVDSLLAPTPGDLRSTDAISGALHGALADGASVRSIETQLKTQGIGVASQSMTELSLGLEAYLSDNPSAQQWHTIAAESGGAALLLDALFTRGDTTGLTINDGVPFYQDARLADLVRGLLADPSTDFGVVQSYLPQAQALGWLVGSIDSDFSTTDLNQLIRTFGRRERPACGRPAPGRGVEQSAVLGRHSRLRNRPGSYYRAVFNTDRSGRRRIPPRTRSAESGCPERGRARQAGLTSRQHGRGVSLCAAGAELLCSDRRRLRLLQPERPAGPLQRRHRRRCVQCSVPGGSSRAASCCGSVQFG